MNIRILLGEIHILQTDKNLRISLIVNVLVKKIASSMKHVYKLDIENGLYLKVPQFLVQYRVIRVTRASAL